MQPPDFSVNEFHMLKGIEKYKKITRFRNI